MSTASSHSPTELKEGKEGSGLSASVMEGLSVLEGGGGGEEEEPGSVRNEK